MHPDSTAATDKELTARALRGDATAFGVLYDRYFDQLYRYIPFRVPDKAMAEGMIGATFVKTWEYLSTRRKGIKNLAWLFRSAHNLVIDYYRTRKAVSTLPLFDGWGLR